MCMMRCVCGCWYDSAQALFGCPVCGRKVVTDEELREFILSAFGTDSEDGVDTSPGRGYTENEN